MNAEVLIGGRPVGDSASCLVIAEAGSNHNGSYEHACRLIDVAAEAGADAVKFQVFRAERLYPRSAGFSDYLKVAKSIYDIITELEMPVKWIPGLAAHCSQRGVQFLASAFDEASVDALDPYVSAYKIASYEMTHYPLLEYVAGRGKPVIVSTGAATIDEVEEMVAEAERIGIKSLVLMQCTAAYPAPLESLNLLTIPAMHQRFGVPVGFSDHSRDAVVGPAAARALGANVVEKHFTLSNLLPGPDHAFALEPGELHRMVRTIREVERSLGTGEKVPHAVEAELRGFARRSVFTIRAMKAGEVFTPENLAVLRCGKVPAGLAPREYPQVLGRRAAQDLATEHALQAGDVD
jgi:N,N'-diacetyllegionaminate synthase